MYGGRGGAKSWGVARALLIIGAERPIRVLCAREVQRTIRDSVHKLLSDQVESLGFQHLYEIQQTVIKGRNGTEFLFSGLRDTDNLKSYEGVTHCWVEEAHNVTKGSWDKLIPTIRAEGSEIWITFNPLLDTDETYTRFVLNPPPGAVVTKIDWRDNPWFPAVLKTEMEHMKETDPDSWLNVWEGHCRQSLDGAIYSNEIRTATEESRLTRVPVDMMLPVDVVFDLGRADMTAMWFVQAFPFEYHIIDFYQGSGFPLSHYLKEMQRRGYVYGDIWLPHDARNKVLASERTIKQQVSDAGYSVKDIGKISIADGINAAREVFGRCWFDKEKCADGLQALRHYRYEVNDRGQVSQTPLHDWSSHAADAFRYFAVSVSPASVPIEVSHRPRRAGGWMA